MIMDNIEDSIEELIKDYSYGEKVLARSHIHLGIALQGYHKLSDDDILKRGEHLMDEQKIAEKIIGFHNG